MPIVSVVIPTYNAGKYLPATINSILEQDFDDLEIIVVDDQSTDNTEEVLNKIGSDKIFYYCLEENHGGPSRPRKIGIKEAKGEFIALCDSDDLFAPGRLNFAVKLLRNHPELGMVFTDEQKFDDATGKDLGNFLKGYDRFHALPKKQVEKDCFVIAPDNAFSCLFFENYIMPSGVTIRRSIFKDIGSFDETLTNGDDRDMWFRITRKYPIGFINKIGFRYRVRAGSISGRGATLSENRIRVLQKQMEASLPDYLHKRCQELIAQHYYSIGYNFQIQGQISKAREYYIESLRTSLNVIALKGVLITLLGGWSYAWLKNRKEQGRGIHDGEG